MHTLGIKRTLIQILSVLMVFIISIGFVVSDEYSGAQVYAESSDTGIKTGDTLRIIEDSWDKEYLVLNPDKTNTNRPGIFLLQKQYSRDGAGATTFNREYESEEDLYTSNFWEGSLVQEWCADYYVSMPSKLKASVIGVKTTETESGWKWAGINNIDGTRTGADINKDKVFLLSYMEYDTYRDSADIQSGEKWFLRSPYACGDLKVYVCAVTEDGSVHDFGTTLPTVMAARPAFNIDSSLKDNAAVCKHDKTTVWNLNANNKDVSYSNIHYTWSGDCSTCTAAAKCDNCGRTVTETVSAITVNGIRKAAFTDGHFADQVIKAPEVKDAKLPKIAVKKIRSGKKSFTIKWKKLSKKKQKAVQGIEVQYSLSKSFPAQSAKTKTKRLKKNKASLKVKKLKSKKRYWVRVRTFKTINGVKHVSKWSKSKKIRTR